MKTNERMFHIKISLCCIMAFIFFCFSGKFGPNPSNGGVAFAATPNASPASQPLPKAPPQEQCSALSAQQIIDKASSASTVTQLTSKLSVLPGGDTATVEISFVPSGNNAYCARFVKSNAPVRVIAAASSGGQKTTLTIEVPDIGFGPQKQEELVLVSFPVDSSGQLTMTSPGVSVRQIVRVSNRYFSCFIALGFVLAAYMLAVLLQGRVGGKLCWDPVYLTSGVNDKASLSQLQVFGFTLLVLGLLVFILFRTSVLSDISSDVLLLLGISAGGTVGSKVTGVVKKRLSFDNSSWLRNHGWLTTYESGTGQEPNPKLARWSDLLKTDGSLDIYSFQLATFSVLVAFALLKSDLSTLATFSIPQNLLGLLGLSNVVYVMGKAVSPNSVSELDKKIDDLRMAEQEWLTQVTTKILPLTTQQDKQRSAISDSPDKYQSYITKAREAARMLKTLYGKEGTKFQDEPIRDEQILPLFP